MDGTREARQEYLKFLILLLFFAALMAGAALLRPLLLGYKRGPEPTASPTFMSILVESTWTPTPTLTPPPTATATLAGSPDPTLQPSPTPTLLSSPSRTVAPMIYLIKAGDTLYRISRKHNVTVTDLVKANGLSDPNRILVGQELVIPMPGGTAGEAPTSTSTETPLLTAAVWYYTIQWGDTLWRIARDFDVELELLVSVNEIIDPSRIVAGQVLEIPR